MSKTFNIPNNAPWRADIVGSFLRPAALKEARALFANGAITAEQLKETEDKEITILINKQKAVGMKVITDGEFRRSYWHLDFMWGFNGVEHTELEHGYQFHHLETTKGSIRLTGKISGENHPFVDHFKFVKQFEEDGIVARQTIPAPAQFYAELFRGDNTLNTLRFYPDQEELIEDIVSAYCTVIKDLAAVGCRNIQLDDCTWGMLVDKAFWKTMAGEGFNVNSLKKTYLTLNNLALQDRPEGVSITTHVCRGNYASSWASEGAYDDIATYLFGKENVDAYYLEYDDERSGGFAPLAEVSDGKKVVLGLITTKNPALEDKQTIIDRVHEASKYISLDRLSLSPQCGFASCEVGNKLTEAEQWAKVALVNEIAKEIWG